jgi:hypothetical protein
MAGTLLLASCSSIHHRSASTTTTSPSTTPQTTAPSTTGPAATTTTAPPTTEAPTTAATTGQVLPPATVAPKVDECTQQLTFGADGNVGPITCPDGDLNVLAWQQMAASNPLVMSLGPYATPSQVEEALCADLRTSTIPIETSAYKISALYYSWSFGIDPSAVLLNGGCPQA